LSELPRRPGAALVLALLTLALATDAAAHQRLLRTEPARDEVTGVVPRELRLSFYEPVELAFTRLELVSATGDVVGLATPALAPDSASVLVAAITGRLQAGSYTVRWSTASRDGHPVRGEYTFEIAADAAGLVPPGAGADVGGELGAAATAPGQESTPAAHHPPPGSPGAGFDADSPGYVLVRWANYLALLGVIGAVAFATLVLGSVRRRTHSEERELITISARRAASFGLGAALLLVLVAVARLYAQSLAMHGADHVLDADRIGMLLSRTVWGWGWLIQAGGTMLALVGFALAARGAGAGWALAGMAALALAVTPALSGHAAAMSGTTGALAIAADTVHVLAAGGWLGSLLVLLVAGIPVAMRLGPARRGAAVASLVNAFSPTALLFAGLLILTGVFATWIHSSSVAALLGSRYGAVLLIKLGIFAVVFGTGAYNFLRVKPALGGDTGTTRLRRSAGVELATGAAVLLVTAVLVATARPYEEGNGAAAGSEPPAAVSIAE
jgi:putative copper export protein/methionine-rich copper-binding protein CopC